ncbi:tRNA epoxyqueuosine(34) reductase QueG [Paracnuella aquatica]|uniref:tRNA epoxyqueuosine(34) reductase QueG n=1 Tax=Paracnuella aquatica TaxID=2268757 RepID=UPI000DEFB3DC|nr:tRNA epoxyqueuosine(34) reductase QueG [Paracnuella aquatica]RPD51299.1 tRNA epoxyqueuosine(34) reductase QueG [Paracnuella aquatica]
MSAAAKYTTFIKDLACRYGFEQCGIARAQQLDEDARRLERWLHGGMHGSMQYMENYFDLRIDPTKLVPGARSVITLLKNYFPAQQPPATDARISKYAWGTDYHWVIKDALKSMMAEMQTAIGQFEGRGFVDSAPVLERAWAQRSGLGWIGRNGNLITKESGSFFFIATLIVDVALEYDDPFARDYCGSCRRCIDACPTEAIGTDKTINGSKCISYFTIELKDAIIPDEQKGRFQNWAFGCDTCQDVCPWNRFSKPNNELQFTPIPEVLNFSTRDWEVLSEEAFRKIFKKSPLSRAKLKGLQRNVRFLAEGANQQV